jgi:hypothetical protein
MPNLSEQDYELISAYLDDELLASARAAFEARLAQEADLGDELEQLRIIRMAVQALPELRAPRRFTLTPQMLGQAAAPPARRALRPRPNWWAGAAAALVVTVVGVGVLLVSRESQPSASGQQVAAMASATPEQEAAETTFTAQPAPPVNQPLLAATTTSLPSPAPTRTLARDTMTATSVASVPTVPAQASPAPASSMATGGMAAGSEETRDNQAGAIADTARALPTAAVIESFAADTEAAPDDSAVTEMAVPQTFAAETGVGDAAPGVMSGPDEEQMALSAVAEAPLLADPLASLLRVAAALAAALWSLLHP